MPGPQLEIAPGVFKPARFCKPKEQVRAARIAAQKRGLIEQWSELIDRLPIEAADRIPELTAEAMLTAKLPVTVSLPQIESELDALQQLLEDHAHG